MSTTQELIERLRERALDHELARDPRPLTPTSTLLKEGADRLASLSAELDALRGKLAGVDEKALEVAAKARWERVRAGWTSEMSRPVLWERLTQFERLAYVDEDRAAIAAYLAAVRDKG